MTEQSKETAGQEPNPDERAEFTGHTAVSHTIEEPSEQVLAETSEALKAETAAAEQDTEEMSILELPSEEKPPIHDTMKETYAYVRQPLGEGQQRPL